MVKQLNYLQEVKVVFIGESGCGKSTLIRHLAKLPDELKYASSSEGHAGTTKVTIEYLFNECEEIYVESVSCNVNYLKDSDVGFAGNPEFGVYLSSFDETKNLDKTEENYEQIINKYAKRYLEEKSIREIFDIINSSNTFFNLISLGVPVHEELYKQMQKNNINKLRIVDTRGLGDKDNIERVIPFAGADAIMIVGKSTSPSPVILDGLIKVCQDYKHLPVLFIGTHAINEDEVDISSSNSLEDYLIKLTEFNKTSDSQIRHLYADVCENHLNIIEPVREVMKECRINNVPYIKSLAIPTTKESNYFKFYIPACIQTFTNCIRTISSYQLAQKDVSNRLRNSSNKDKLFEAMRSKKSLEEVVEILTIKPRDYDNYVDFVSVAQGVSHRHGSPLDYSYNCVAATLYTMLKVSTDNAVFSVDNTISNDILIFFFNRVLQHNSHNWYWGFDTGYYYTVVNFSNSLVRTSKKKLKEQELALDHVVCNRFGNKYSQNISIQILLFEEGLRYLINEIDSDVEVKNYFSNTIDANPA